MKERMMPTQLPRSQALFAAAALLTMLTGCASGSNGSSSLAPSAPAGSTGSTSYNYAGTQGVDGSGDIFQQVKFGGTWALTLDIPGNYFSYKNIANGYDQTQSIGTLSGTGFVRMTGTSVTGTVGAAGIAVVIPGEAVALRTAGSKMPPVISALNGCPTFTGTNTYQFISFGTSAVHDVNTHVAYGSVDINQSNTSYSYANYKMYGFAGTALNPSALPPSNCAYTQMGYVLNTPASKDTNNLTLTTAISPSGYFILDQGQGEPASINLASFPATGQIGLVGVQKPSSAIDASKLVATKMLGFEFDPVGVSLKRNASLAVSFGQPAGSGTVLNGGTYPGDDVTQAPVSNIKIDLGPQDSGNNGLFKNVTVTLPDAYGGCVSTGFGGTDAGGNPTCIFHGAAAAGQPNGKFVLFVTVNDVSLNVSHYTPDAALDFFLYQQ